MDKKKIIYIGSLLILTVIVSITYFSYAFFTHRDEQRGKLNIVTGTLDYKIKSADLTNNSITLEANKSKQIEIEIISLNKISSKYELYYQTEDSNVVVGYGSSNDTPTGTINSNAKKTVKLVIKNKSNSQATITFGVEGGFINNTLVLSAGNHITDVIDNICNYDTGYVWNFPFDPDGDGQGQVQEFTVPCDGNYRLQVWGASGGNATGGDGLTPGGKGGYSFGLVNLNTSEKIYITVGGGGNTTSSFNNYTIVGNGYNGGGATAIQNYAEQCGASGGGGATHIGKTQTLLKNTSLSDLYIVAGGGGGSAVCFTTTKHSGSGGAGGGLTGITGTPSTTHPGSNALGGTQSVGGTNSYNPRVLTAASYGTGCIPVPDTSVSPNLGYMNTPGGGGLYGGACGTHGGGGGGSSYIGGVTNGSTIAGNQSMPTHDGTSTMIGNTGNGYACITYLGE